MNFNSYGSYYGKFHKCTVSSVQQNTIIFDFATTPYEGWLMIRLHPPEKVYIDSKKPFLLALKTFFKSDVPASVVCNDKYLWTVCLGNERMVFPISKDVNREHKFQLYATPYYVKSPDVMSQYLEGAVGPAYENVFFYKNTILYLDNQDLPFPGGSYFDPNDPAPYYRICFLSDEPTEYVLKVAAEWKSRRSVDYVPYMTRDVEAVPKFINFRPVCDLGFGDAGVASTGMIYKSLSARKPEHLIQDVLNSYYTNVARRSYEKLTTFNGLGLFIEWPLLLTFEGAQHSESACQPKKFVALSVNGTPPNRVLYVTRPYERYVEHNSVPATLWTPISFVSSTLITDASVRKVVIDTCVVGLVYRDAFFCLSEPLLEGMPTKKPLINGKYILSPATFNLSEDPNVHVVEAFKYNDRYSLRRVSLKGTSLDTWCLTKPCDLDPFPKTVKLPELVNRWLDFFLEVEGESGNMDVNVVRLALMLSKHHICFSLNAVPNSKEPLTIRNGAVNFNLEEKVVQFINDARLLTRENTESMEEEGTGCSVS